MIRTDKDERHQIGMAEGDRGILVVERNVGDIRDGDTRRIIEEG